MPQEQDHGCTVALSTPLLESQPTLLCDGGSGGEDSKCSGLIEVASHHRDGKAVQHGSGCNGKGAVPQLPVHGFGSHCSTAAILNRRQSFEDSSRLSAASDVDGRLNTAPVLYGELVVLGYNGCLPTGDRGRKRSKFTLCQRTTANGVKPIKTHHIVNGPRDQKVIHDKGHSTVSYTLSRNESVVVEYAPDAATDMFQVGRASDDSIDCVVVDTIAGSGSSSSAGGGAAVQSTISRFACRILVDRSPPYCARIFAAGFDSKRNIMLGEKASKWYRNGEIDGLTTNGIQLMHPLGEYSSGGTPGLWREVSVGGGIYALRGTRSVPNSSAPLVEVGGTTGDGNVLRDGTLIDLCGATLLWRSASGLDSTLSTETLEKEIERLNACRPQCPVGLNTLAFARKRGHPGTAVGGGLSSSASSNHSCHGGGLGGGSGSGGCPTADGDAQPYVYISCGHVHGAHRWGAPPAAATAAATANHQQHQAAIATATRVCPLCMKSGPFIPVQVGSEPSVYTDSGSPTTHCFVPCAHMASERTVKYWASVAIPYGCQGFRAMCPFCATPLSGDVGYVPLIFQSMDT